MIITISIDNAMEMITNAAFEVNTQFAGLAQLGLERRPYKAEVIGSIPISCTTTK
jgi:hypothetical protein